ncbi:unnamed protein product [Rodentolepis nana]|uniref:WD_REPEATS_REGION domain-containing protein n=1 Tax=Rodentolepis nana TaxID=102285 RepID=A0A0R3TGS3_RODNA|nr:unnamed protein product [Rodentolepis nana]
MSPVDDTFLSGALDGTGVMHVAGRPTAAFDPEGLVFAAGINSEYLNLYDLRSFDKGPFATFKLPASEAPGTEWTSLKFSPDGRSILICTNGNFLRLVDSFNGAHLHSFKVSNNVEKQTLDACFTPTSQYLISTSPDSMLHVFSVEMGAPMAQLATYEAASKMVGPQARINCVAFNPRFAMIATGSMQTCFWLPNIEKE